MLVGWRFGDFELALSYDLLYELEAVLLRRYFRDKLSFSDVIWLREHADFFVPTPNVEVEGVTPDPDDDYLVGIAYSFGATFVVSGNISHFPSGGSVLGVEFVTPRQFADFLVRRRR